MAVNILGSPHMPGLHDLIDIHSRANIQNEGAPFVPLWKLCPSQKHGLMTNLSSPCYWSAPSIEYLSLFDRWYKVVSDRLQFSYAVLFSTIELATYIYLPLIDNFLIDKFLHVLNFWSCWWRGLGNWQYIIVVSH